MYLDSAIIVKLLVREEDSGWFDRNFAGHPLWSSELSLAEVRSAIFIKERTGQISAASGKAPCPLSKSCVRRNKCGCIR